MFSLRTAAHSEIGLVRSNNQDSAYTSPSMIVVADGMGGAAAGDLASSVAIRELQAADRQNADERLANDQMLEAMGGALAKANDGLADLVAWDHALEGMGSTVCGAMFSGTQLGVAHIGDSRGYLLRDGKLIQFTHDHSWVQSLVDQGKLAPEEMATHPHRSLLMKVLNGQPTHSPDLFVVDVQRGDRLLFCSDGLSGMVSDQRISQLLRSDKPLEQIVKNLTRAAHAGGGTDNITLVVADVVDFDPRLAAVPAKVLGAAAIVEIPSVDVSLLDLGAKDNRPARPVVAPAPAPINGEEPPEGLIDPDRFEAIRYAPHIASRRRRFLPMIFIIVALLALIIGTIFGAQQYLNSRWFIYTQPSDSQIAEIYQGLPEAILGHKLYSKVETSNVHVEDLPTYYAAKVRDGALNYGSLEQARETMAHLDSLAQKCRAERQAKAGGAGGAGEPTPQPSEASKTTSTPEPDPSTSATSASASAAASPTAGETFRPDLEACA